MKKQNKEHLDFLYSLKPGPETDKVIYEKVLGGKLGEGFSLDQIFPWSTDIHWTFELIKQFTSPVKDTMKVISDEEVENVPNKVVLEKLIFNRMGYKCCDHDEDGTHGQWECRLELSVKEEDEDGKCKDCNHARDQHKTIWETVKGPVDPPFTICNMIPCKCDGFVSKIPDGMYTHNAPEMAICLAFLDLVYDIGKPLTSL